MAAEDIAFAALGLPSKDWTASSDVASSWRRVAAALQHDLELRRTLASVAPVVQQR
jgi:hypothetical protein